MNHQSQTREGRRNKSDAVTFPSSVPNMKGWKEKWKEQLNRDSIHMGSIVVSGAFSNSPGACEP